MSILRFRNVCTPSQIKKISDYLKKLVADFTDSRQKQVLNALIDAIDAMEPDEFGIIQKDKMSQDSIPRVKKNFEEASYEDNSQS